MTPGAEDVTALVRSLVTQLVDDPDSVSVSGSESDSAELLVEISVAEGDAGKVIGRRGRIINALRVLARACASQHGLRVDVELVEDDDDIDSDDDPGDTYDDTPADDPGDTSDGDATGE